MTDGRLALVVVLGLLFGLLLALQLSPFVRLYRGSAARRPRDVSGEGRLPPRAAAPLVADLVALGFERLGEVELTLPSTSGLGLFMPREARHATWVFVDSQDTTVAEVVAVGPTVGLLSTLADGTVVETTYPRRPRIDEPDIWATSVGTSIADAYAAHRQALDRRFDDHGQPRAVHDLGTYLLHDAEYRRRFAQRVLRRPLIRNVLLPAAIALGAVLLLSLWLLGLGRFQ